ncbi:MAG TPA: glutamine synthetase family protein [Geminicoccus sp.]|uniref:glutamine synthetase family protein n=1 Tax=Geminicoccus sp. TaxID=2024832 RepID=UPI002B817AE1|nr:glutamine synthetase family protein [Geminicoccus sp.]HWL71653.1 glutamine synthetase family protein [Geminicoccus sp.]
MTDWNTTPLASIVTTDLAAITRGRPVTHDRLDRIAQTGVGWVPANLCLTAFNVIADPNPWGSTGDLRIIPDLQARFSTDRTGAPTLFDMVMGDLTELDGTPWSCCPRSQLKAALAALQEATGLRVQAAFEQELQLAPADPATPPGHAFSFGALRAADPFAPRLMAAMEQAGIEPEMVLAEYGPHQFEVIHAPADALAAADRAVAIREIAREVALHLGRRASFTPKPERGGVGNGVHIHFSFLDEAGRPAMHDAAGPGGLSAVALAFLAGVLRHLPALTALTAASVPSYYRLAPHNWSASYTWLGERDREATLRICPTVRIAGRDIARQFNVEYRAADATANPYLALAALVRAGLAGITERLAPPPVVSGDPALMDEAECHRLGLRRLPLSLEAALAALEADATVTDWFGSAMIESYMAVKRAEIARLDGRDESEICAIYRALY